MIAHIATTPKPINATACQSIESPLVSPASPIGSLSVFVAFDSMVPEPKFTFQPDESKTASYGLVCVPNAEDGPAAGALSARPTMLAPCNSVLGSISGP
jgi:hypothetical protein